VATALLARASCSKLLPRNLAIGQQIRDAGTRPDQIREPVAFRSAHVEGLDTFRADKQTIVVTPLRAPADAHSFALPWVTLTSGMPPELSDLR
jgi:hypothetical protein